MLLITYLCQKEVSECQNILLRLDLRRVRALRHDAMGCEQTKWSNTVNYNKIHRRLNYLLALLIIINGLPYNHWVLAGTPSATHIYIHSELMMPHSSLLSLQMSFPHKNPFKRIPKRTLLLITFTTRTLKY